MKEVNKWQFCKSTQAPFFIPYSNIAFFASSSWPWPNDIIYSLNSYAFFSSSACPSSAWLFSLLFLSSGFDLLSPWLLFSSWFSWLFSLFSSSGFFSSSFCSCLFASSSSLSSFSSSSLSSLSNSANLSNSLNLASSSFLFNSSSYRSFLIFSNLLLKLRKSWVGSAPFDKMNIIGVFQSLSS